MSGFPMLNSDGDCALTGDFEECPDSGCDVCQHYIQYQTDMDEELKELASTKEEPKSPTVINAICRMCSKSTEIHCYLEDYIAWQQGKLIQDAFPYLTPNEREMLKGMCSECWDKMCPSEDDIPF